MSKETKTYEFMAEIEAYIVFDESDIPKGKTAEEYAEALYCEGDWQIDGHDIKEIF